MAVEPSQTSQASGSQSPGLVISRITSLAALEPHLPSLRRLLQRCVNDEPSASSIGFFAPLADHAAVSYWLELVASCAPPPASPPASPRTSTTNTTTSNAAAPPRPAAVLLVATHADVPGTLATVQIAPCGRETHAHRGEVRKLLVHPTYRRHGFGRLMMAEVERLARDELGLQVLTLDAARESPAREFYLREGWAEVGVCPDYARSADGRTHATSFFVKRVEEPAADEEPDKDELDTMDP